MQSDIDKVKMGYYIYKEIYENDKNEASRFLYLNSLKRLFNSGLVTIKDKGYYTKIKEAFYLAVSFKEICLLLISLIPPLYRFVYRWRPDNSFGEEQQLKMRA